MFKSSKSSVKRFLVEGWQCDLDIFVFQSSLSGVFTQEEKLYEFLDESQTE